MTQPIQMYRSTDGTVHETEHASLRADLRHILSTVDGMNNAIALKIVDTLCESRERVFEVAQVLRWLYDTHPTVPGDNRE